MQRQLSYNCFSYQLHYIEHYYLWLSFWKVTKIEYSSKWLSAVCRGGVYKKFLKWWPIKIAFFFFLTHYLMKYILFHFYHLDIFVNSITDFSGHWTATIWISLVFFRHACWVIHATVKNLPLYIPCITVVPQLLLIQFSRMLLIPSPYSFFQWKHLKRWETW